MGQSALRNRTVPSWNVGVYGSAKPQIFDPKGNLVKIPELCGAGRPRKGARAATHSKRETLVVAPGRVLSSLLRTEPLESVRPEIGEQFL